MGLLSNLSLGIGDTVYNFITLLDSAFFIYILKVYVKIVELYLYGIPVYTENGLFDRVAVCLKIQNYA